MAVLDLHCCTGFFSCFGKWGPLSNCGVRASQARGFSCCRAWPLGMQALIAVAPGIRITGSVAVAHKFSCSTAGGIFLDQG